MVIIDEDLGLSGSSTDKRSGFARLTSEVALAHVGIVLGLEVSRLARNNADWYRLLELCGVTDTLIGDNDGVYHPALFNDRLLLGLKGTMSEAELHIIRARLDGGIRNKAARGELRRGLPVGFVWGEQDGEVLFHPDEAVTGAIRTVFERFAEFGSARRVWLWFRSEGLSFPLQNGSRRSAWPDPLGRSDLHRAPSHPHQSGVCWRLHLRQDDAERYVDEQGVVRKRMRHLPMDQWAVLIPDHHPGFIDWATFQANQARLDSNTRPRPHQSGGAVREGSALLQGIATCGHCGRRLHDHYRGRNSTPGYHCCRQRYRQWTRRSTASTIGGLAIEQAVANAFLEAVTPAAVEATMLAVEQLQANHDAALSQWRLEVERARYEAERAERRYRSRGARKSAGRARPGNRMGESPARSGRRRSGIAPPRATAARPARPRTTETTAGSTRLRYSQSLDAPTTTDRDRKELLAHAAGRSDLRISSAPKVAAHLTLRWRGGAITPLDVPVPRFRPMGPRTDEDTISLLRRLAALYPDEVIAGILNRQGRKTATGERFTANQVGSLRRYRNIPRFQPPAEPPNGELVSIRKAAQILGHEHVQRFIAGWPMVSSPASKSLPARRGRFESPMSCARASCSRRRRSICRCWRATMKLGVSRQTVLQRVKRGELEAVLVRQGRRKGLRIKVVDQQPELFEHIS